MIQNGDIIKHEKFIDVALLIVKVTDGAGVYRVRAYWINQGFYKTFILPVPTQEIVIEIEDLDLWCKCKNKNSKCVRYEQWENLKGVA